MQNVELRHLASYIHIISHPFVLLFRGQPVILQAMRKASFEWDTEKDRQTRKKHDVDFATAQNAFADPQRVILSDEEHSAEESRYYCLGRVGDGILTVRFTYRSQVIRIFGAGYWRKGKKLYEEQNHIHR